MTNKDGAARLIRYDEAGVVSKEIVDKVVRAFIDYGLTTVLTRMNMDPAIAPKADFDLRFFTEILRAMASDRHTLSQIVQGDPEILRWWPKDT